VAATVTNKKKAGRVARRLGTIENGHLIKNHGVCAWVGGKDILEGKVREKKKASRIVHGEREK